MSDSTIAWSHKGEHADGGEALANVQISRVGATLLHDVFGECKLVSADDSVAKGSFKVQVLSDNSERELTRGHFVVASISVAEAKSKPVEAPVNSEQGEEAAEQEAAKAKDTESIAEEAAEEAADAAEKMQEGVEPAAAADSYAGPQVDSASADAAAPVATEVSNEAETTEQAPTESEQNDAQDGVNAPPIYEATIAAASRHVVEFNLDPEDLELVFFKSLVLLDFGGVHDSPENGGRAFLRPGTIVRERSTGFFFVTTSIYKPLPGFLVDKEQGVHVDERGEEHTLKFAKTSRMLGGNKGHFSGEKDAIVVCLRNPNRFGSVWISVDVQDLKSVFDFQTPSADKAEAICKDYAPLMSSYPEEWKALYHKTVGDDVVHGGGVMLEETALKSTSNLYNLFRRRGAKVYETKAEIEAAAEVTEVPAPAQAVGVRLSRRKRTPVLPTAVEVSDDDEKKGGAAAGRAKRARTARAAQQPQQRPTTPAQPQTPAQHTRPPPTVQQLPPPCFDADLGDSPPSPVRDKPKREAELQMPEPATAAPVAPKPLQPMGASAINSRVDAAPPAATPAFNSSPTCAELPADNAFGQQQVANTVQGNAAQQQYNAMPGTMGAAAMQDPRMMQAVQQQQQPATMMGAAPFNGYINPFGAQFAQCAYPQPLLPYNYFMPPQMPFAFPPHAFGNQFFHPAMMPQQQPSAPPPVPPPAPKEKEQLSPSLAAIQARLAYEDKKKAALLDSQAMHEYYQEKYGVKK